MSLFSTLKPAARDPILGLNEAFNLDDRPHKVNLGIGVYTDEEGEIPLLNSVARADKIHFNSRPTHNYLPIDGLPKYISAVQNLLFGNHCTLLEEERLVTVQSLGGTGALKIGADFLRNLRPNATVAISNPSWANHRSLFETAGFSVCNYRYYNQETHNVDHAGLIEDLKQLPTQSIVLLHACCHNPTGVDLSKEDWKSIIDIIREKDHIPFIDMAYQGFADGIEQDLIAIRLLTQANIPFLLSNSFSKTFSLYGERTGALSICTKSRQEAALVRASLKRVIRTNYSNPPTYGASIVSIVLNSNELQPLWNNELDSMRERIQTMRQIMVDQLNDQQNKIDFNFVILQKGMFSYSGLNPAQVKQLQEQFGIYILGSGRICIAALNRQNMNYVTQAIAQILRE
ncbi:UNVERIFIED_CONTAM: hypothetical protein GTU68_036254 [Idotea baltica]|nr:hypothetical protein [Idotea baltica]